MAGMLRNLLLGMAGMQQGPEAGMAAPEVVKSKMPEAQLLGMAGTAAEQQLQLAKQLMTNSWQRSEQLRWNGNLPSTGRLQMAAEKARLSSERRRPKVERQLLPMACLLLLAPKEELLTWHLQKPGTKHDCNRPVGLVGRLCVLHHMSKFSQRRMQPLNDPLEEVLVSLVQ